MQRMAIIKQSKGKALMAQNLIKAIKGQSCDGSKLTLRLTGFSHGFM
jgi:hypothetical protein